MSKDIHFVESDTKHWIKKPKGFQIYKKATEWGKKAALKDLWIMQNPTFSGLDYAKHIETFSKLERFQLSAQSNLFIMILQIMRLAE